MTKTYQYLSKIIRLNSIETISWFFRNFIFRYKYYLLLVVTLGFSAASMQGGILLLINSLVTNSQVAINFHQLFLKLNIHIKLEWFVFLIIVIGLALSSLFVFLQAKLTLKLWRKYQIHLTNNLLKALCEAVKRGVRIDSELIKSSPISSALKSTQRMGAFTRLVINSILPLMRFLIFSAFAFYSQPQISIFVFLIVLPVGALVLLSSAKKASTNDYQSETLAQKSLMEFDKRIETAFESGDYEIKSTPNSTDSSITLRLDKLLSSLMLAERSRFLMSLLTIVMLAVVTIFGGLMNNPSGTVELLIYLVSLIMAFSQLSNVLTIASHFGRFYPTVHRYRLVYDWLILANSDSSISNVLSNSVYKYTSVTNAEELIE